jgi:UDP-N-acetylmuramoylalanine--D-glutamate ligase
MHENYIVSKFRQHKTKKILIDLIYDDDDEAIAEWFKNNTTKAQKIPLSIEKSNQQKAHPTTTMKNN